MSDIYRCPRCAMPMEINYGRTQEVSWAYFRCYHCNYKTQDYTGKNDREAKKNLLAAESELQDESA